MNALDYYCEFMNSIYEKSLTNVNDINQLYGCVNNNYLYILKDKLSGPIRIVASGDSLVYKEGSIPEEQASWNEYIIFIPYGKYTIVLKVNVMGTIDSLNLFVYKKESDVTFIQFLFSNVQSIIDFLKIDKLNEALDFIMVTLQVIYNKTLSLNKYLNKYESLIEKSVDCCVQHLGLSTIVTEYYYIYSFTSDKFFLNIEGKNYTFNSCAEGIYAGIIYYIEIDKRRSISIIMSQGKDIITLCYYKDDSVTSHSISFSRLEETLKMVCDLINRKDIYRYLKQIQFFDKDIFYWKGKKLWMQ